MMHETLPGQRSEVAGAEAQEGLFHRLIAGNYFYFLSAALMLLGCCLLMHSSAITGGIFTRTLKTLLVLQGYEVLVIATALAIVWRFGVLDDAFSLLLVELLLLLDPTFFSNSFFTMPQTELKMLATGGVLVNVVCFALVPLKLMILQRGLRLRFSAGCWVAFIFAAAFAYLAEGPLCRRIPLPGFSPAAYHYLLAWAPLIFAALLPPVSRTVAVAVSGTISAARRGGIGVLFLLLPLGVILAHLIESARVHEMTFHIYIFSPLVLGLAVLIIRQAQTKDQEVVRALMFLCDLCAGAALIFATGWLEEETKIKAGSYATLPAFAVAHRPLALAAAGIAGVYLFFTIKFRHRPALYRLILLALAGAGAALWWFEGTHAFAVSIQHWFAGVWHGTVSSSHSGANWLSHALGTVIAHIKPILDAIGHTFLEILQGIILLILVLDHCRKKHFRAENRVLLAGFVALFGLIRFGLTPVAWAAEVCGAEVLLFLLAGLLLRPRLYLLIAAVQAFILFAVAMDSVPVFSHHVEAGVSNFSDWLGRHPELDTAAVWVVLLALAFRFRNVFTWFMLGLLTIWIAAGRLPGGHSEWIAEIVQAVFILGIALDHRFGNPANRSGRYLLAVIVAATACVQFFDHPALWSGLIVVTEVCGFLIAGVALRHPGYLVVGLIQGAAIAAGGWNSLTVHVNPATLAIAAALACFAIGIAVTFNKDRLLGWVKSTQVEAQTEMASKWLANLSIPQPSPESAINNNAAQPPSAVPQSSTAEGGCATCHESTPPPDPKERRRQELRIRATVSRLFNSTPPFEIALASDLTPTESEGFKTEINDPRDNKTAIFLIKGDPQSTAWTIVPAWICYPADPSD